MAPYCLAFKGMLTKLFYQSFQAQLSHNHGSAHSGLPCLPPSFLPFLSWPTCWGCPLFFLPFEALLPSHLLQEAMKTPASTELPHL